MSAVSEAHGQFKIRVNELRNLRCDVRSWSRSMFLRVRATCSANHELSSTAKTKQDSESKHEPTISVSRRSATGSTAESARNIAAGLNEADWPPSEAAAAADAGGTLFFSSPRLDAEPEEADAAATAARSEVAAVGAEAPSSCSTHVRNRPRCRMLMPRPAKTNKLDACGQSVSVVHTVEFVSDVLLNGQQRVLARRIAGQRHELSGQRANLTGARRSSSGKRSNRCWPIHLREQQLGGFAAVRVVHDLVLAGTPAQTTKARQARPQFKDVCGHQATHHGERASGLSGHSG